MESDTPRTDAEEWITRVEVDDPVHGLRVLDVRVVDADFARQLERELAAAKDELAAERATTASLLRIIALIREAGGFKRDGLAALPDAVKAMRQQRDEARGQTWYLLYGGTSEDGMGTGHYIGRTTDKEVARKHHAELRKSPYSIGFVEIVTDTEKKQASYYGRELETKKEGGGAC